MPHDTQCVKAKHPLVAMTTRIAPLLTPDVFDVAVPIDPFLPLTPLIRAVREALEAGLRVVPPSEDGQKRPFSEHVTLPYLLSIGLTEEQALAVLEKKERHYTWKHWRHVAPSPAKMFDWWVTRGLTGMGFLPGAPSGGIFLFELDHLSFDDLRARAETPEWSARGLPALLWRIFAGFRSDTPGGGVHGLIGFYDNAPAPNGKLALSSTKLTMIETKGEGGFAIEAPSHGRVHPTGRPYVLRSGGFSTIQRLTKGEYALLREFAESFNEAPTRLTRATMVSAAPRPVGEQGGMENDDPSTPWGAYNAATTWPQLLEGDGWQAYKTVGDVTHWTRPGKSRHQGSSATTNRNGWDRLYVFTSSSGLEDHRWYTRATYYAAIHHGGDNAAAARALRALGYGDRNWRPTPKTPGVFGEAPQAAPEPKAAPKAATEATEPRAETGPDRPWRASRRGRFWINTQAEANGLATEFDVYAPIDRHNPNIQTYLNALFFKKHHIAEAYRDCGSGSGGDCEEHGPNRRKRYKSCQLPYCGYCLTKTGNRLLDKHISLPEGGRVRHLVWHITAPVAGQEEYRDVLERHWRRVYDGVRKLLGRKAFAGKLSLGFAVAIWPESLVIQVRLQLLEGDDRDSTEAADRLMRKEYGGVLQSNRVTADPDLVVLQAVEDSRKTLLAGEERLYLAVEAFFQHTKGKHLFQAYDLLRDDGAKSGVLDENGEEATLVLPDAKNDAKNDVQTEGDPEGAKAARKERRRVMVTLRQEAAKAARKKAADDRRKRQESEDKCPECGKPLRWHAIEPRRDITWTPEALAKWKASPIGVEQDGTPIYDGDPEAARKLAYREYVAWSPPKRA